MEVDICRFCQAAKKPQISLKLFVEPEGFEPSSKHGINYAFYMLDCCLIVGKGKVRSSPVPSSVDVFSRRVITSLNPDQFCCSMPLMLSNRTEPSGTKAYLILN